MATSTASKTSTGKPKIGGAIYVAPAGTSLPDDATTALANTFKALGYISEDGLTNDNSMTVEQIRAWGGDVVLTSQTERNDTFTFTLMQVMDTDVLKTVFGDSNVTVETGGDINIEVNGTPLGSHVWAIELVLNGNTAKRIVIPNGVISELGEITYKDDEAVGYEVTITAIPDSSENTHYEYIHFATTTSQS